MKIQEDKLLDREIINISLSKNLDYIKNKRVLVTGAGGTIGSELSKQLIFGGAERLYILDHNENSLYNLNQKLKNVNKKNFNSSEAIVPIIGELQDFDYINYLMSKLHSDIVFHAAAYKHVPLLEENPIEAIRNNVYGTYNIVQCSERYNVNKFIYISTDKAVEPVSCYGVSKYLSEEIIFSKNSNKFLVVRFGNVLASSGSVIPLFLKQIENKEPITLTEPEAKRFWMTSEEATSLVLKIGGVGKYGMLYILEMGNSISIKTILERLLKELGKENYPVKIIGLRKGEKLVEKLYSKTEIPMNTRYRGIRKVERGIGVENINNILETMRPFCYYDPETPSLFRRRREFKNFLKEICPSLNIYEGEQEY